MDARQLHADFAQRGFVLHARDGRIKVRPASRLSEADREAIQVHREELLDLLVGVEALELVRRVDPDAMLITVRPVANTGPLPAVDRRPAFELHSRRIEVTKVLAEGRVGDRVLDALRRGGTRAAEDQRSVVAARQAGFHREYMDGRDRPGGRRHCEEH